MSAKIRLMIRVVKRRIAAGESIEDILAGWPALTDEEKAEIKAAVEGE